MVYYIIMAAAFVIFLLLHILIFPKMFLKAHSLFAGDRAVRDIPEAGGRSIIYAPGKKYSSYIKHYIVSENDGKKQLKCEVDKNLRYLEYDIRMFDNKGRLIKIYTVKEVLDGSGYTTGAVDLDDMTAFVNVIVRTADDKQLPLDKARKVSGGGIFMYFLCSSITEIVCAFVVKICIGKLFGGIYHETFLMSLDSTLITLAVCAVMIILNITVTCVSLRKYVRGKAVKRGKHA